MGTALRLMVVSPSEEVIRLSLARYARLCSPDSGEVISEFAGTRIRAAEVVVQLASDSPASVLRVLYFHLVFRADGALDYDRFMREGIVPLEASPDWWPRQREHSRVIPAGQRFATRRLKDVVRWRPSASLEDRLLDVALGVTQCRRL
jgi:hypothetical protein